MMWIASRPISFFHIIFLLCNSASGQERGTQPTGKSTTPKPPTRKLTTPKPPQTAVPHVSDEHEPGEDPPYDGWFNNLIHPDWGAADSQLLRISPPAYADGVYSPARADGPNALNVSQMLHHGKQGLRTSQNRTAFMVFFGQQLVEEIVDAQRQACPPEHMEIPVPLNHKFHNESKHKTRLVLPIRRARFDQSTGFSPNMPRQQLNEITPFIDGNLVYGPLKAWTDAIRSYEGGRLKAKNETAPIKDSFPAINDIRLPYANPPIPLTNAHKPVNRFHTIGNPRGNENPFMLTMGILWFRWHNHVASVVQKKLNASGHSADDELIFNEARKLVIAQYQKIVMYDWLPMWLGSKNQLNSAKNNYTGYKPHVHPGISQEFQTAAMRYGHTLLPTSVYRRYGNCTRIDTTSKTHAPGANASKPAIRLCNTFWNAEGAVADGKDGNGIDTLIMGLASTPAEKEDHIVTDDVRLNVFGPREFTRRDLVALNIMRGRDHGVADYNSVREAFGLKRRTSIKEAFGDNNNVKDPSVIESLYGDINSMDLFVGGLLETDEDGPGELFRTIMEDQFTRIRDGDRFWYENYEQNKIITKEQLDEITRTRIIDIILAVTNIEKDGIQDNPFSKKDDPCLMGKFDHLTTAKDLEDCSPLYQYDFFVGSQVSFPITFSVVFLLIVSALVLQVVLVNRRKRHNWAERNKRGVTVKEQPGKYNALEWLGPKTAKRKVTVSFDATRYKILVSSSGATVRMLDLRKITETIVTRRANDGDKDLIVVRVPKESDLVLRFSSNERMMRFSEDLGDFIRDIGCRIQETENTAKVLLETAESKEKRQAVINDVMKVVCLQAFGQDKSIPVSQESFDQVINIEMTKSEFAEILSLQPNSLFVRNMFTLVDKDNNGFLTFREFLDMFVVFTSASAEVKTKLMFDMYDVRRKGYLRIKDFQALIRSMLELGNANLDQEKVDSLCKGMLEGAGLTDKTEIYFKHFNAIFNDYKDTIGMATINMQGVSADATHHEGKGGNDLNRRLRKTIIKYQDGERKSGGTSRPITRTKSVRLTTLQRKPDQQEHKFTSFFRFIENYRLHIFWLAIYTFVTAGIFLERAYYYSFEREHGGLRKIAGYGVTVTRGAASGMMFTYATLLVTMTRNVITSLRETFINRFLPLDAYISFHKYVACLALFFTVLHVVGHSINLYHICTQTSADITCLFREYHRSNHEVATFHYWAFQTMTGLTGILLTIIVILMYVFALQYSRRHLFKIFWLTHNLYPYLFVLMTMHGMGRLVQPPLTHYFILAPVVLFVIDKFMTFGRRSLELSVSKAEILPSDVTALLIKKPRNFDYRSGQWVRIACLEMSKNEYHPFTLSSAPHEDCLSLHIRAVGPWTKNLRRIYDKNYRDNRPFPRLYLDGPYGEGHQDWYQYDVSVMVGGGIGVTPFASILKDIVYKSRIGAAIQCQKVYFLWVTRTQKHFEWMTDIIRQVEESDGSDMVSVHIFITQFFHKFDLRTTMLYICERNFQKVAQKSLFTGLRSVTHFGRPDFYDFLLSLAEEHSRVNQFGVFSCGPPPMTRNVENACSKLNSYRGPTYVHHYENF